MYITVADDITAICGGTLISETSNGNGTKIFHWKMANDIPTYLASVAVGSYVAVRDTFDGMNQRVPIAIYVRPVDSVKAVGSFVHLKEILAIYENRFGPYSWERVGYVGASLGAMEHATNITYPNSSINGNTTDEWLYAHELSHMWFGDKVTCASAEDMWLNEGWAVFCESVFKEGLYGKQAYKDNIRSKLKEVLQFTHHTDLEYRAIYGIPPEFTYGSTVYDKGGQVAHTLRGYLGDSLFFDGIKGFLTEFVYNHASSWDLRDYLTARTGINLDAFFETWIFTPGFPHFSVDSFTVVPTDNQYNVTVYTKQKARGTNHYSAANRVEITFLNDQWNFTSDTMIFSGLTGQKTFQLPFAPEAVLMDANDKLSDAVTAYSDTIKGTGLREYPDCFFKLDVQNVSNSAFLRIEHNWVAPDSLKTPQYGLTLSDYRYWKVDGIFPAEFSANGWFNYNKGSYLDNTLITDPDDSLVILYRPSPASDWQAIAFTRIGPWGIGNIIVNNLQKGEYTLAVWDETVAGAGEKKNKAGGFLLYPNPSGSDVIIEYSIEKKGVMEVYSLAGKKMDAFRLSPGKHQYCYKHSQLTSGTYLLKMRLDAGEDYIVKKLVIH
jgi:aminopeptidase N